MPFINIPNLLATEHRFAPLPKTWYEEQVDTDPTKTIRFAKRSDHTGLIVKIDKLIFYSRYVHIPP